MIGRLMRSATTGFVFGCTLPEPDVPRFGDFVRAPAQRGRIDVIGLVYDIVIQDDAFVRPLVAAGDLPDEYILDQRRNRQVPVEVSVLAVGYRQNEPDGDVSGFQQGLPPQPPVTLDAIVACTRDEIAAYLNTRKASEQAQGLAKIRIRQLGEQLAACEKALAERDARVLVLTRFALNIRDGWDCDEDAHRHRTLCRCCEAEKLVGPAA